MGAKTHCHPWPYLSLVITMAQIFVRKSSQKNVGLDYTFLLEVSIKGSVLNFTDDKAKGYEIYEQAFRKNCHHSYSRVQENHRQGKGAIRQKCQKMSMCLNIN